MEAELTNHKQYKKELEELREAHKTLANDKQKDEACFSNVVILWWFGLIIAFLLQ